jgi:hypothetical protein
MKGEADEETRSRVVGSLKANALELMAFLEARKERIIRVLHGLVDVSALATEALPEHAQKPTAEKDERDVQPER